MPNHIIERVPTTRYQGSKRKILPWLYDNLRGLEFENVLDGFGGTASVSYLFKLMGKSVTFNDILSSNYQTGLAVVVNDTLTLDDRDINFLLHENGYHYPTFIRDTFKDIYYTNAENKWLDVILYNIKMLANLYDEHHLQTKKALAYHALFQACLCKRPFNLFHRKNLYLRTANTERSFGNKTTWDMDFDILFIRFVEELKKKVFSNGKKHTALCQDIMDCKGLVYDLVYFDPPYARLTNSHNVDYYASYHFLEGLVNYENWPSKIDWSTKNKRLLNQISNWKTTTLEANFEHLFQLFQNSIIVVSYGQPGNPPISTIERLLKKYKSDVSIVQKEYAYRLNHRNGDGLYEVLIVGK